MSVNTFLWAQKKVKEGGLPPQKRSKTIMRASPPPTQLQSLLRVDALPPHDTATNILCSPESESVDGEVEGDEQHTEDNDEEMWEEQKLRMYQSLMDPDFE